MKIWRLITLILVTSIGVLGCVPAGTNANRGSAGGHTPVAGENGVLSWGNGVDSLNWLAVDDESWDAMHEAIRIRDEVGILQLENAKRIYRLRSADKTRVFVLDRSPTARKVRILEGPHTGISGWVTKEFVQPARN